MNGRDVCAVFLAMRCLRWPWLLLLAACNGSGDGDDPVEQAGAGGANAAGASAADAGGTNAGDSSADPDGGSPDGGDDDAASGAGGGGGAAGRVSCGLAGCGQTVPVDQGRVDMLFVVDDSGSMSQEQAALAMEFPRLLRKLTSGDHDEDGMAEQAQVTDLHLGVVSTNLGAAGVPDIDKCGGVGDDALLARSGNGAACSDEYPVFLSYEAGTTDAAQLGVDFGCIATLGTNGCGFEQQLEVALKALWPSSDPTITFTALDFEHSLGRGDRENAGFLRNGADGGLAATLAIVLVTDEDDCSVWDPSIWLPNQYLQPGDPRLMQSLNLRCFMNPEARYELDRYLHGYRALHAHTQARVVFAAITGVPVDLVDQQTVREVDFADDAEREAHYRRILDDPRMIERTDETVAPELQNLIPACESDFGVAYPARRIVELARRFGRDGLVQSICGDNFGPPIDLVVKRVVRGPE
jgi:hypothetical protein